MALGDRIQYYLQLSRALIRLRLHNAGEGDKAFFRILNQEPAILLLALHDRDLSPLHEAIGSEPGYFFFNLWGSRENNRSVRKVVQFERRRKRHYPHHNYIYLCNAPAEVTLLREAGLEAVLCNHNCWIDEELFRPEPADKLYDAVYDANIAPYKRHRLAAEIRSLALISFRHPVLFNQRYARQVRQELNHACWLNDPLANDHIFLSSEQVVQILNQSRVGLCLSPVEGAMYASIQYLLCGLPVVSTASKGGRDVFFEDDYALIVADDPRAVSSGVQEMIRRQPDPHHIRQRTIATMNLHRLTFIDQLQQIFDQHQSGLRAAEIWPLLFKHKMGLEYRTLEDGAAELKSSAPGGLVYEPTA